MTLKLQPAPPPLRGMPQGATIIVALSIVGIPVLLLWYLLRPRPLFVRGEADATLIDLAAQVDGRVATRSVHRGENMQSGQWGGPAPRTSSTASPVQE
jgi:HlyD family secretion protein